MRGGENPTALLSLVKIHQLFWDYWWEAETYTNTVASVIRPDKTSKDGHKTVSLTGNLRYHDAQCIVNLMRYS
jgi:hypothetical protein